MRPDVACDRRDDCLSDFAAASPAGDAHHRRALVEQPKNVKVKQSKKENYTVMELSVSAVDLGKVIGKNGQTARAIRTIVNAAASKAGDKIIFEIKE